MRSGPGRTCLGLAKPTCAAGGEEVAHRLADDRVVLRAGQLGTSIKFARQDRGLAFLPWSCGARFN
jgi:hypothetical protein